MIKEMTTIVEVESDCLWVEGVQQSTCGSCKARAGCGQRLLSGLQVKPSRVRVLYGDDDKRKYQIGQQIQIGIPEEIVVKGALFIYLCPLLGLFLFSGIADYSMGLEWLTICLGIVGFCMGGVVVRLVSSRFKNEQRLHPVSLATNHVDIIRS